MLILGIDPGLVKTGWGIIHYKGSALTYRASGLIRTNSKNSLGQRLAELQTGLGEVLKAWEPDAAAVEETFLNRNPKSTLKLGQARGICLAAPALHGIDVGEYATNKIKKSLVGVGHATKEQMQMMIKRLLPNCGQISEDEADALAVAICHAHYGSWNNKVLSNTA